MSSTIVVAPDHLSAGIGDEAVVLGVSRGLYYGLGGVGSHIWTMIQTPKRVSDIRDEVVRIYDVDEQTCEHDVLRFLAELDTNGIIEVSNDEPDR